MDQPHRQGPHSGRIVGIEPGGAASNGGAAEAGAGDRHVTDLVSTIYLAAVYGLLGVGISLTWAGLGFLNLAHGVTFAAAGYGAWWAQEHISGHPSVIFLGGIVVGALAGAIICLTVFLPLDGRPN
jgi:branched-subunit amino acid ABC-type transport system permease component